MNKLITSIVILLGIILAGCSPKLGKQFYRTQDDIQIQQWGNYLPNGWRAGVMSDNYPGVFAIVNEEIIFDAQGPGSKPWMKIIGPFKIMKSEILDIELSEELAFGRKILTVQTTSQSYSFFLMNADEIFKITKEWWAKIGINKSLCLTGRYMQLPAASTQKLIKTEFRNSWPAGPG